MEGNKGQRPRPGPRRKGEEQRTATTPAHSASATHHRNKTPQRTAANHVSYLEHRFFARSRSYCSEKGAARGRGGGPVRAAQQSKRTVRAVNAGTPHCTPAPSPHGLRDTAWRRRCYQATPALSVIARLEETKRVAKAGKGAGAAALAAQLTSLNLLTLLLVHVERRPAHAGGRYQRSVTACTGSTGVASRCERGEREK